MSYASIDDESDDEDDFRRAPILIDPAPSPHEILEENEFRETVRAVIATLPEREAEIIDRRFGLKNGGDGETLEEIGQDKNVTRERIRQIEAKGLRRLRLGQRLRMLMPFKGEGWNKKLDEV